MGTHRFQRAVVGGRPIDRNQTFPKSPGLRRVIVACNRAHPAHKRAAGLQWIFHSRLRAGSDAYPGVRRVKLNMNRRNFLQNSAIGLTGLFAASSKAGSNAARIQLVTRGDDLGCARSLNRAMKECYEKGILKNCSVLAATPYIEEAARMLANAKAEEALIELQAQLDRARRLGFDIKYADLHMGTVQRVPGLAEKFGPWCRSQGIIDTRGIGKPLPNRPSPWNNPGRKREGDYVEQLIAALKSAPDGEYLIVGHVAYDDKETRRLGHEGYPGDSVSHNLNWERLGYTDPRIVRFINENGVRPIRYDETEAAREQAKEFSQADPKN